MRPTTGVVFVRNTTEAINLVASSYATQLLEPGDRIVVTVMEHHSNLVPWQLAAERRGLELAAIDIDADGRLDLGNLDALLAPPTRLVAVGHQSNVLGTVNDLRTITERAHAAGALVCVDAAQSVPHMRVSVRELDCDFIAFSGHKMCGPMGIGVLWARPELLERMPPFLGGGSMISRVTPRAQHVEHGAAQVRGGHARRRRGGGPGGGVRLHRRGRPRSHPRARDVA